MPTKSSKTSIIAQRRAQARKSGDKEYMQRQAQLLKVAGKIFEEKGYRAASINDFAKAIGVDRASLYYYTSGKEELYQEVVRVVVLRNVESAERIHSSDKSPKEKMREFIIEMMQSYETHYPYFYAYVQEDMAQISNKRTRWAREMSAFTARFNDALLSIIEQGLADGSIRKNLGSPRIIALGIIGMCNWSHRWFKPGGPETAETIGRSFAEMVLNGVCEPGNG